MKKIALFLFITFSALAKAQTKNVTLDSIAKYEGKTITICEKVQSTYQTKGEHKNVMLSFGKPYPKNTFTVMIFESDLEKFSYNPVEKLNNKTVCITGKVVIYKDKPEIIITKEEDIIIK